MQTLSGWPLFITILAMAAGTILTRFLPFWIFPKGKDAPEFIKRLQSLLPPAVIGLLVVYCFRNVDMLAAPHGLPELLGAFAVAALHLWRRNTLLSIAGGTAVYMVLVQSAVF